MFVNQEYLPFPVTDHDDMFDALARILDESLEAKFPMEDAGKVDLRRFSTELQGTSGWMAS